MGLVKLLPCKASANDVPTVKRLGQGPFIKKGGAASLLSSHRCFTRGHHQDSNNPVLARFALRPRFLGDIHKANMLSYKTVW
ncbi:hypothetical protein CEP54_002845 [Fusarium duplospermum]|uniref:Uncharacterized protein n=1 Tax=Fusarium duplospermum TaxID=1325734 RepID=A0A428QSZ3_9HYPO|nr:hypothetical protein CEP54_002845 [Fusarium duplospermum]